MALLLALTAAAAAGGCSETKPSAPVLTTDTGAAATNVNRMPFDAYQLSPTQQAEQSVLYAVIRNRCLGILAPGPERIKRQIQESVAISREFASRRYGISDPQLARAYGYHLSPRTLGVSRPKSLSTFTASERKRLAACSTRADAIVYGSDAQQTGGPGASMARKTRDAFEATQRDPRVKAVFARWSACLKAYGYRYANPIDAAKDVRWSGEQSKPTTLEIGVARADVACKARNRLVEIEFTIESAYQRKALDNSESTFAAVKRALDKDAARIRTLMPQYAN
ncbi:hypothetical protein ACWCQS_41750 [Streptomyces sp. NPDC002076]